MFITRYFLGCLALKNGSCYEELNVMRRYALLFHTFSNSLDLAVELPNQDDLFTCKDTSHVILGKYELLFI